MSSTKLCDSSEKEVPTTSRLATVQIGDIDFVGTKTHNFDDFHAAFVKLQSDYAVTKDELEKRSKTNTVRSRRMDAMDAKFANHECEICTSHVLVVILFLLCFIFGVWCCTAISSVRTVQLEFHSRIGGAESASSKSFTSAPPSAFNNVSPPKSISPSAGRSIPSDILNEGDLPSLARALPYSRAQSAGQALLYVGAAFKEHLKSLKLSINILEESHKHFGGHHMSTIVLKDNVFIIEASIQIVENLQKQMSSTLQLAWVPIGGEYGQGWVYKTAVYQMLHHNLRPLGVDVRLFTSEGTTFIYATFSQ